LAVLAEGLRAAWDVLWANRLRSGLAACGLVIGVAAVITTLTAVGIVEHALDAELSAAGSRTFRIQRGPAPGSPAISWRHIIRRRPIEVAHASVLRARLPAAESVSVELWHGASKLRLDTAPHDGRADVCGCTPDYFATFAYTVALGRGLVAEDSAVARRVIVLESGLAERLFPFTNPLGREIDVDGRAFEVVGVLAPSPSLLLSRARASAFIPLATFLRHYGPRARDGRLRSVAISVRLRASTDLADAMAESRALLRGMRGIRPGEDDDFAVVAYDAFVAKARRMATGLRLAAVLIGGLIVLVSGVGIINITLASVGQRVSEIGLRRAVGAKRRDIGWQFLLESAVLCASGGAIGTVLGATAGNLLARWAGYPAAVPLGAMLFAVGACGGAGLLFGIWPALRAARLAPIDALRAE
jgi:putative ABC transport system permease protein